MNVLRVSRLIYNLNRSGKSPGSRQKKKQILCDQGGNIANFAILGYCCCGRVSRLPRGFSAGRSKCTKIHVLFLGGADEGIGEVQCGRYLAIKSCVCRARTAVIAVYPRWRIEPATLCEDNRPKFFSIRKTYDEQHPLQEQQYPTPPRARVQWSPMWTPHLPVEDNFSALPVL